MREWPSTSLHLLAVVASHSTSVRLSLCGQFRTSKFISPLINTPGHSPLHDVALYGDHVLLRYILEAGFVSGVNVAALQVKDAEGMAVSVKDERHFCRTCHDFAAVTVDCFQCHASKPEIAKKPMPTHKAHQQLTQKVTKP